MDTRHSRKCTLHRKCTYKGNTSLRLQLNLHTCILSLLHRMNTWVYRYHLRNIHTYYNLFRHYMNMWDYVVHFGNLEKTRSKYHNRIHFLKFRRRTSTICLFPCSKDTFLKYIWKQHPHLYNYNRLHTFLHCKGRLFLTKELHTRLDWLLVRVLNL